MLEKKRAKDPWRDCQTVRSACQTHLIQEWQVAGGMIAGCTSIQQIWKSATRRYWQGHQQGLLLAEGPPFMQVKRRVVLKALQNYGIVGRFWSPPIFWLGTHVAIMLTYNCVFYLHCGHVLASCQVLTGVEIKNCRTMFFSRGKEAFFSRGLNSHLSNTTLTESQPKRSPDFHICTKILVLGRRNWVENSQCFIMFYRLWGFRFTKPSARSGN